MWHSVHVCVVVVSVQEMYSSGAESSILVWSPKQKIVRPSSVKSGPQVRTYMHVFSTCVERVTSMRFLYEVPLLSFILLQLPYEDQWSDEDE